MHLTNIHGTEWTFLLLNTLSAGREMALSILVSELFTTVVRAGELAHVEHVGDLAGNLHLLEALLAEWTYTVMCQPLI